MEPETVHAVVLKRRDSGENDRRLTLLTKEHGVMDVVAKGARKGGSRLAGSSEPLSACILHVTAKKSNQFVTQAQPISTFPGLRVEYDRLSYALALAELAAAVLPYGQPAEESFDFMVRGLHAIEIHEKPTVAFIWSEVKLIEINGFLPSFNECAVTGERVREALAFLSPHAGGYVNAADALRFTDRYQVRAEVLYSLAALAGLSEPPANLKLANECIIAALPFWRAIAERSLPANEACVAELRHVGHSV